METLVKKPTFVVTYAGKNITADISDDVLDVSYTDVLEGESDTVSITLKNDHGKWIDAWYPTKGDELSLSIGYENQSLLPCGTFEVDTVGFSGKPDTVSISALGTGVKKPVRTNNARAFEQTTLADIVKNIAGRNKLTVVGDVPQIAIGRATQAHENDLSFLRRLSDEYGYFFTVKGDQLVFSKRSELKATNAILTLNKINIASYEFNDQISSTAEGAEVRWHDPHAATVKSATVAEKKAQTSSDKLKLNIRAETPEQAELKADSALEKHNQDQCTGNLSLEGNQRLVAGLNIELAGFGKFSGKYQISKSSHKIARSSGYGMTLEIRKVQK